MSANQLQERLGHGRGVHRRCEVADAGGGVLNGALAQFTVSARSRSGSGPIDLRLGRAA